MGKTERKEHEMSDNNNALTPELETEEFIQDCIQGAADFVTDGIQSFDGYVTDCAEEVADYDILFLSGFEQGYLGRGDSFSISKALGSVGKGAVNLVEGMVIFPVQTVGHPIKTIEGVMGTPRNIYRDSVTETGRNE